MDDTIDDGLLEAQPLVTCTNLHARVNILRSYNLDEPKTNHCAISCWDLEIYLIFFGGDFLTIPLNDQFLVSRES